MCCGDPGIHCMRGAARCRQMCGARSEVLHIASWFAYSCVMTVRDGLFRSVGVVVVRGGGVRDVVAWCYLVPCFMA